MRVCVLHPFAHLAKRAGFDFAASPWPAPQGRPFNRLEPLFPSKRAVHRQDADGKLRAATTSFVEALQQAVAQFAEFAIQEMTAVEEGQYRGTTLHDFAAGAL